eukprot:5361395-Alexandrium_andersonii.AAC.1
MSASLVGSEMCIRDRAIRRRGSCGGRGSHAARSCSGRRTSAACSRSLGACLLYTSDAADDM